MSLFLLGPLAGALALSACTAIAQTNIDWNVPLGSYSVETNWTSMFGEVLPDAGFDEIANIGNGGIAFVEDTPDPLPGGVIIQNNSTLEIRSGGNLMVLVGGGGFAIGSAAVQSGRLIGLAGGSFTAESLSTTGGGTIDLSGNTMVTITGASTLGGTTRLAGPNVVFATESLASTGTISAEITAATHSAIDVSGAATLGGKLVVTFDGVSPSFGQTWNIVDAQSITGNFANVTSNVSPGPGLVVGSRIVSGGNGQLAQATLEPRLTVQLNRRTGQVQIRDLAGVQATTIDGYYISSRGGTFDPNEWSKFGGPWVPSTGDPTSVGESTLTGQREVGASEGIDLGDFYANPARSTEFGLMVEDAEFQYSLKTGEVLTGLVDYTDAHNMVVLVVDADTGDTWMQNQSIFDIEIDGYQIESLSGALDPAEFVSFASTLAGWTEANPAEYNIGELSLAGTRALGGEGDPISLGKIFTPGSDRDLVFTFTTPDFEGAAMTLTGVVEYDDGPVDFRPGGGISGDYNGNGTVEQADLDLVLLNWGQSGVPNGWINELPEGNIDQAELDGVLLNWGDMAAQGLGGASGVPEPSAALVALICLPLLAMRSCRPRHRTT
jgi:hypothetical protein